MNTIKRDVYVLRNTIKIPIEVTKGTDMLGLEFAVRDYEIPATAAAVAYVYHKSMDKPKGTLCDVDNSVISFTPSGDFFAVGMNELQIRVINDGKSLISFKETIKCSDTMGFPDDEEEKQKTLVEQLLTKVGKEEGDRKTADDTEREERIAADDAEKKARIAEENARAEADEAIRANRIVTLDEIDLVTEEGFFVDALAVKELNSNLTKANNILTNMESNLMAINTYHMTLNTSNVKTPDSWIECNRIGNLVMINGCAKITKAVNTYSTLNIASGAPVPCCNKQLYTVAIAQDNTYSNCFLEVSKSGAVNLLVRWQKASSGDTFYYEFCYICK